MHSNIQTSRREFLRLCALSLSGMLLWPNAASKAQTNSGYQGRICISEITLYEKPSFQSKPTKTYWKDNVLPITAVTIGDDEPKYNRVWYQFSGEGFAHSGAVQPVLIQLNKPAPSLPASGGVQRNFGLRL